MRTKTPLWQPSASRASRANLTGFMQRCGVSNYGELYQWSIADPINFWSHVWKECAVIASVQPSSILEDRLKMPGARWFSAAKLNFAENLLRRDDQATAISFWGEDQASRKISFSELRRQVGALAHRLIERGVKNGDRVVALVPNCPESIVTMLACASIGAIWSSCSPDFGVNGVLDRFEQIVPQVLICSDGYFHKGRWFDISEKVEAIRAKLPSVHTTIVFAYANNLRSRPNAALDYADIISTSESNLQFQQLPFNHPLYIMFSSGTTGKPKCIVHSAGGTLIEHLKELVLHCDLKNTDRFFYQTTCGWMMWNFLVSGLAVGAQLVLYDGNPLERDGRILWDMADQEEITIFGTNAKYIALIEKLALIPASSHKLSALTTILSTGSPLLPENFEYVYRAVKSDLLLSSIAGGTDIIGCFALGCPLLPVYSGELQTRSLGLAVNVYDGGGHALVSKKGELVCTAPFPSMPLGFWNDHDGSRFRQTYFEHFPGAWYHGDYVELTESGGMIFYGRSDATLNPGGIRIGTSEIYRQVESFDEIEESIAIGQEWRGDVRLLLFVKMKKGVELTEGLKEMISQQLRTQASPHHVPKLIIAVPDIPRTRSGKIVELAVRDVIHARAIKNIEALANPEALKYFEDLRSILDI